MAMTHDYLDYLNETVEYAPANTQEEYQAAQTIADLMADHGVEPEIEEFQTPVFTGLTSAVVAILAFVGMIFAGVGGTVLAIIGIILTAIPAVYVTLTLIGKTPSLNVGPAAHSQNVVAFHEATGPNVIKGSRKIVIVAHYDTPRIDFLRHTTFARYLPNINKIAYWCSYVVFVCALLQVFTFLPNGVRIFFLIVGIIASVPALLLAVQAIVGRLTNSTAGANDNNSGVAAMLGILEKVRPSGNDLSERVAKVRAEREAAEAAAIAADEDVAYGSEGSVGEPVARSATTTSLFDDADAEATHVAMPVNEPPAIEGVRHGAEAIRYLGILPETCEIVYDLAPAPEPAPASSYSEPVSAYPVTTYDDDEEAFDAGSDATASMPRIVPIPTIDATDSSSSYYSEVSVGSNDDRSFSLIMDDEPRGVGEKDMSGLVNDTYDESLDPDATVPGIRMDTTRPAAPDDPDWGQTTYRPQVSDVARRASLYDLPDPSESNDPLASSTPGQTPRYQTSSTSSSRRTSVATTSADDSEETPKKKSFFDRFRNKKKNDDSSDYDDDGFYDDDSSWRGGATTRSGLRFVDENGDLDDDLPFDNAPHDEQLPLEGGDYGSSSGYGDSDSAPTDADLVDAVLRLGDDDLIAHDIWFVALGGSELDHAGMKDFLARHRRDIRGSFVINLDCVGAGDLTLLSSEGLDNPHRADRRLINSFAEVAKDLHVPLSTMPYDWAETDATPAMRSTLRAVTLVGIDEDDLPALSHTNDDVPVNVNADQVDTVVQMVCELIRRS